MNIFSGLRKDLREDFLNSANALIRELRFLSKSPDKLDDAKTLVRWGSKFVSETASSLTAVGILSADEYAQLVIKFQKMKDSIYGPVTTKEKEALEDKEIDTELNRLNDRRRNTYR